MDRRWEGFNRIVIILAWKSRERARIFVSNTILLGIEKYRRSSSTIDEATSIYLFTDTLLPCLSKNTFDPRGKANWWILGNYSGGKELSFFFWSSKKISRLVSCLITRSTVMTVLKRRGEFKEKRINRKNRAKSRDNFLLRISHGINPSFKYTKKFLFPSAKLIKKRKKERIKESSSLGSDASSSIVF